MTTADPNTTNRETVETPWPGSPPLSFGSGRWVARLVSQPRPSQATNLTVTR